MRVTIDGQEYRVAWSYYHPSPEASVGVGIVHCNIGCDDGPLSLYGYAVCSRRDRFNRKIGRKVALTRAIKDKPRDFRSQVWAAYLAMQHGRW